MVTFHPVLPSCLLFVQAGGGRGSIHHARGADLSSMHYPWPRAWWMLPLPPPACLCKNMTPTP